MADLDNLINSFTRYVVRPVNAFGLGGFVFDVPDETTVTISAEITDHFTEDNSAIQDHIAARPKRVVLGQYVGELVHRLDGSTNTPIQQVARKLTGLAPYLPKLTAGARQIKGFFEGGPNRLDRLTDITVSSAADLWATIKNLTPPTARQQQAYMYFKALCEQKILVSLETPFEFMTSMAVESVVARQGADSTGISEFTVTLKEMRFAQTRTAPFDALKYQSSGGVTSAASTPVGQNSGVIGPNNVPLGRAGAQTAPVANKGTVQGRVPLAVEVAKSAKQMGLGKLTLPPVLGITNLPPL